MSVNRRRVRAIFRKELREYRHNGNSYGDDYS